MVLETINRIDGDTTRGEEVLSLKPAMIPVLVGKLPRNEMPIAVGFIRAEDLIPRARIAHREFEGGTGYQRLPSPTRVKSLARDISREKVDLPTALLLNLRDYDESTNLIENTGGVTYLSLTDEGLWEVDGQHRCQGLKIALEDHPDKFRGYTIPFVLGLGWSQDYEMEQFFVVNSTAKSVPTSIAYDILATMSYNIPGLRQDLEESGRGWQVLGQELAKELADSSQIWTNRIRFSNQPKGTTTVPSAGFVNSLKPVLGAAISGGLTVVLKSKCSPPFGRHSERFCPGCLRNRKTTCCRRASGCR